MLYYKTISEEVLELIQGLQADPVFNGMRLAGGTALALQTGHRVSIDIDMFGKLQSDEYSVSQALMLRGKTVQIRKSANINMYVVNDIKVDIVNYSYKWLEPSVNESGIILAHPKDIAAMKLAAITGRGSKKDFIDLFFLLNDFSLQEMLSFFSKKYPDGTEFLVLKSLTWFEDADNDEMPSMLINCNWDTVKKVIRKQVQDHIDRRKE